jgi:fibronectin-binding autotransporter adhesin
MGSGQGEGMQSKIRRGGRTVRSWSARAAALVILAWQVVPGGRCLADDTWTDGTGNWNTPGNWSAGVPGNGGAVDIINTNGVSRTVTYNYTGAAVSLGDLFIDLTGGGSSAANTLSMSGNNLTSVGTEVIGVNGAGVFNQSGGTNTTTSSNVISILLAQNTGSVGAYTLSGSGVIAASGSEDIGYGGTGSFNQSGGTNTISGSADYLNVGYNTGSGTYTLTGGSLAASNGEYVGDGYGTGQFNQSGGTNTFGSVLFVGNIAGYSGTYTLSGSGFLTASGSGSNEYVGFIGTGYFNQNGGTNTVGGYLSVGEKFGSIGTYTLNSGSLSISGSSSDEYVGYQGTGYFNQSGGTNTVGGLYLSVGDQAGGNGTYSLSGTGSVTTPEIDVAYKGTGNFNQSGGTVTITGNNSALYVGNDSGSNGAYTLSGTGTLNVSTGTGNNANEEYVGNYGTGQFNQSGGTNSAAFVTVGYYSGASGTYALSGGSLAVSADEIVGENPGAAANFNQTGGTNTVNGFLTVGNSGGSNGTFTLGGIGSLSASSEYVGDLGTGTFTQTGGTNTIGGTSSSDLYVGNIAGSTGTYTLSGNGSLSVNGVGSGIYGNEFVGYSGTGYFNQNGGTNSLYSLFIGSQSGSAGTYTLSDGSISVPGFEIIGDYGTGYFNQSGGTANPDWIILGEDTGGSGNYNLSGTGNLSCPHEEVGDYSSGTFTQTGGTNTVTGTEFSYNTTVFVGLDIGLWAGSNGNYMLSGGNLNAAVIYIGGNLENYDDANAPIGQGTLSVSGGSLNTPNLYVGADWNGSHGQGTLSVNNAGSVTVTGTLEVFNSAGSALNLSGGSITTGSLNLNGDPALLNWTGGTLDLTNSSVIIDTGADAWNGFSSLALNSGMVFEANLPETVGGNGTGSITVAGGENIVSNGLFIGYGTGSVGNYTLSYGLLGSNGGEVIGAFGTGTFNQYGGVNNPVSGSVSIGSSSGSSGTYTLSGGTLLSPSNIYVGGSSGGPGGTGVLNVSGSGAIAYGGPITVFNTPGSGFNVYGGSVSATALNLIGSYNQTAGSAAFGHITGGGQLTVSGGEIILTDDTTGNLSSVDVEGPVTLGFDIGTTSSSEIVTNTATFNAAPTIVLTLSGTPASGSAFALLSATTMNDNGYLGGLSEDAITFGRYTITPTFFGGNGGPGSIIAIVSGGPANLSWIGNSNINYDGGGAWDTQTTQNWENHSNEALTPDYFYTGDNVTFDDTAANYVVDLDSGDVTPGSVTFNNSLNAYTVNGFSAIAGACNVTFSGSNSVTLNNNNSYYGTTTISGGGLVLVNGTLASPTINVTNGTLQLGADYILNDTPTVNLGSGITPDLNGPNVHVISTTGVLDLNGTNTNALGGLTGGPGNIVTNSSFSPATLIFAGGSSQFGGTIQDGNNGGTTALDVTSGCLTLSGFSTYSGGTTVDGGKLIIANSAALGAGGLTINNSATAKLAPRLGAPVQVPYLSIAGGSYPTATLDITNNTFIISYTGFSPATLVEQQIASAYDMGNWDGAGITSSTAAANTQGSTTIGYVDTGTQVIIKYTWVGDANLDGVVDASDLAAICPNGTTWATGDFNYDGVVNADDYALFMLGAASGGTNISTTLPEPNLFFLASSLWLGASTLRYRRAVAKDSA